MGKGKLIEIEGTDSSGKETQVKKLIEKMESFSIPCVSVDFPRYDTPSGRIVGQSYLGRDVNFHGWEGESAWFGDPDKVDARAVCAYYAADRRMARPFIVGNLDKGTHVVTDRYVDANKGHQGGKIRNKKERLCLYEDLDNLEYGFMQLPRPDLVIFLHMPTDVSLVLKDRRNFETSVGSDGHENNVAHLRRAEAAYLELADLHGWVKISCAPDGTISSLKTPEEIHKEVWGKVRNFLISQR